MVDASPEFPLVSVQWLKGRLDDPDIVVLDATYHLPGTGRDAQAEFLAKRIPGARFFDIDAVKDPENPLPHMVPSPELFAEAVGAMGISNASHVVCYDTHGIFSAARPWWMFRLFGHDAVSVLDGGLRAWADAGLPTESGAPEAPAPAAFEADFRPELLRRLADLQSAEGSGERILDARPAERFEGRVPEPREGLRSGHIPGAANLPFNALTHPDTGRMLDVRALASLFERAGVRLGRDKVVTSCGSGVTACTLALGLHLLGQTDVAVYDGSWTEWGSHPGTPTETGPAA